MIYAVRHRSSYTYAEAVDLSYHILHLIPRSLPHQRVLEAGLATMPTAAPTSGTDYFGNHTSFLSVTVPHERFVVESTARVEVAPRRPPDPAAMPSWEAVRDAVSSDRLRDAIEAAEFIHASPLVPLIAEAAAYAMPSFAPGRPFLDALHDLTRRIHRDFTYDPSATAVTTPLADVLERHRGVCQDFAHLQVAALRSMGLPARYVSGYIRTYGSGTGQWLVGADGSHAWVSAWCPGFGWIDVDPTNDLLVGDEHIVLAWGRDYDDVSPIRGVIRGGGAHLPEVAVEVTPAG